ncbi:unnamed protein product [Timema podura]|uniref:Uncharacterized protein n=1 Tax=Timema podura TaxID=61482 RepID=A0ABN7NZJ8_TIMPD|nr:unnamed protein product [Timema podura]
MPNRFKRFDNKFIRPLLIRDHQGAEPKILETYSKLAMKDAMDYMRRNASTIGNISGTESMSAIFRNYTAGNFHGNIVGNLNGRLHLTLSLRQRCSRSGTHTRLMACNLFYAYVFTAAYSRRCYVKLQLASK